MEYVVIFSTAIAAVLALTTKVKWKELNVLKKAGYIIGVVAAISTAYVSCTKYQEQQFIRKVEASFGTIKDMEGAIVPQLAIGFNYDEPLPYQWPNGDFIVKDEPYFKFYVKNGKLHVNIVVRDSTGNPMIAVYDNEWEKYDDAYEFNYDETALEFVTKGDRDVFFHLEFKKGILHVEGLLYRRAKTGVLLFDNGTGSAFSSGLLIIDEKTKITNYPRKRLFKYPKERYLGVREDTF